VTFSYQLKNDIKESEVKLLIDSGYNTLKTKPTTTEIKDKALITKHQFNSAGFYDVHFYIGEDLISTYTVKVKS
jgi:hypothetical protein